MGALLTSILQGAGRAGGELQEARTANLQDDFRMQQFKAQMAELQSRLGSQGLENQLKVAPQVVHTYRGSDGKVHNIVRDPLTGRNSDQLAPGPGEMGAGDEIKRKFNELMGRDPNPDEAAILAGITPKPSAGQSEYEKRSEQWQADEELRKRNPQMWRELHPPKDATPGVPVKLNPADETYAQKIASNQMTMDQLAKIMVGKTGMGRRQAIMDRATELGWNANASITPTAQKALFTIAPTMQQMDRLLKHIDDLGLGKNNTPGYLAWSRAKYGLGVSSPEGSLGTDIAGLSLGSVVEAAAALLGSSRSIQALQIALVHTPNPWVDSPKLIREKLVTINERLQDVMDDVKKYGTKSGLENTTGNAGGVIVVNPEDVK